MFIGDVYTIKDARRYVAECREVDINWTRNASATALNHIRNIRAEKAGCAYSLMHGDWILPNGKKYPRAILKTLLVD